MFSSWGKSIKKGQAGIALTAEGMAYAGLISSGSRPLLQDGGFFAAPQNAVLAQFEAVSQRENFKDWRLGVCLDSSRFNLSMIDTPAVGNDELLQALTWKVKDLIDFPLDELVMDYVDVPPTKSGTEMVYAVTSRELAIRQIVDQAHAVEGTLERIDIPALALQNIISRLPQTEEGIALLNLTRRDSLLTLGRGEKLYLSRGVDTRSSDLRERHLSSDGSLDFTLFDNLLLDIQRSLDYYDSFFVDPPIRHLLVPAADHAFDDLIEYLDQNLSIEVRVFALEELVAPAENLQQDPELYGELLLAVGAALCPAGLDA